MLYIPYSGAGFGAQCVCIVLCILHCVATFSVVYPGSGKPRPKPHHLQGEKYSLACKILSEDLQFWIDMNFYIFIHNHLFCLCLLYLIVCLKLEKSLLFL